MGFFSRKPKRSGSTNSSTSTYGSQSSLNESIETIDPCARPLEEEYAPAPAFRERDACGHCATVFQRPLRRRHHCRNCGESCCKKCLSSTKRRIPWPSAQPREDTVDVADPEAQAKKDKKKKKKMEKKKKAKAKQAKLEKVCRRCDQEVFNGMAVSEMDASQIQRSQSDKSASHAASSPDFFYAMNRTQVDESQETLSASMSVRACASVADVTSNSPMPTMNASSGRHEHQERRARNKSLRHSMWLLPIRPLLKRKERKEFLRKQPWDIAWEKAHMMNGSRTHCAHSS